jgi:hypothetical protein
MEHLKKADQARQALASYHGVAPDDPSIESEIQTCDQAIQKKLEKKKLTVGALNGIDKVAFSILLKRHLRSWEH